MARQRSDSLVPMGLGVAVECREHDGQDPGSVVADQTHDVLIVPVVQSSLGHLTLQYNKVTYTEDNNSECVFGWEWMRHLEVRAGHTLGQLPEERLHNFDELRRLDDVQDLLQFVEEHHLFRTVCLWPIL